MESNPPEHCRIPEHINRSSIVICSEFVLEIATGVLIHYLIEILC